MNGDFYVICEEKKNLDLSSFVVMDLGTFRSVSFPVCTASLLLNLFLVFCMFFPKQETERLKQPLNVLLGNLVGFNICNHVCVFLFFIVRNDLYSVIPSVTLFAMRASVSSSLWLNVFYYCQIVPAQRSVFIYLKRNIRFFIYSALIIDKVFLMFSFVLSVSFNALYQEFSAHNLSVTNIDLDEKIHTITIIYFVELWLRSSYSLLCLCVMLVSSSATIKYLHRHMKRMEESSRSSSSTRLHRQLRVTITGIVQTVLYFLCLAWMVFSELALFVFCMIFDLNGLIFFTVLILYTFGTTVNLCVGQKIFRQRVAEVWQLFQCFQYPVESLISHK